MLGHFYKELKSYRILTLYLQVHICLYSTDWKSKTLLSKAAMSSSKKEGKKK